MFKTSGDLHLHIAVPYFAGDQLIRSLRRLPASLLDAGTCIPDPEHYRRRLTASVGGQRDGFLTPLDVERLAAHLDQGAERLVLSFTDLMGPADQVFEGGRVYREAGERISRLRDLFPNRCMKLFFTAANPAAVTGALMNAGLLSPAARTRARAQRPLWGGLLDRLDRMHPDLEMAIWAAEDTPVTWPLILRRVLGRKAPLAAPETVAPAAALLGEIPRETFRRQLAARPRSETELMLFISDFLHRHADPAKLRFEIKEEGWTDALVAEFAALYREDLDACENLPQVEVITLETALPA